MELPEITIRTLAVAHDRCAICGREWRPDAVPVPTAYTLESIGEDHPHPPKVVCDHCVMEHYPESFADLLRDRQRFWGAGSP